MLNNFIKVNLETKNSMNKNVIDNYSKLKLSLFFLPILLLFSVVLFLYHNNALSVDQYVQVQKHYFYFLNSKIGQFPGFVYNLTQIGI